MRIKSYHLAILFLALDALGALFSACGTIPGAAPEATPTVVPPTATIPAAPPSTPADPSAPSLPPPTTTPLPRCTDQASFVSDVTVPDDTVVAPGLLFVKTWQLLNIGTCTWTSDYHLVFSRGDQMGGPTALPLPGPVKPGQTVDLSTQLTAPQSDSTYTGRWQLRNAEGEGFGIAQSHDGTFVVRIVVRRTPDPTPTPVVPPTLPVVHDWKGEYFDTLDLGLSRLPVLVRNDKDIDFDWGRDAPAAGLPADGFSVRWTRRISFDEGTYHFTLRVDDGAILYIDDEMVIDAWKDGPARDVYAEYALAGGEHTVRIEYYDRGGLAQIRFWYEKG